MLLYVLNNGEASFQDIVISLFISVFFIFAFAPIHEWAHAFAAYKLGDDTARLNGRMTLNPMAHLDPIGTLCIFLFGFGWAKPVPVNIYNFKYSKRKLYMGLTALAGPLSNIIIAFIVMVVLRVVFIYALSIPFKFFEALTNALVLLVFINIRWAVFNLIPVPPLDGSRIASILLPNKLYYRLMEYERYIFIVLLVLIFTGAFSVVIGNITAVIYNAFVSLLFFPK